MFFIIRAGDEFEQIVLAEGPGPKAPNPDNKPSCWHFNFCVRGNDLRSAFEVNTYTETIFESIESDTAIALYFGHMADSFGWSAEYPQEGFETKQAAWDCIRTKWVEKQLEHLTRAQKDYNKWIAEAKNGNDTEKLEHFQTQLANIAELIENLKTT